jgi:alpha-L-fucosidase
MSRPDRFRPLGGCRLRRVLFLAGFLGALAGRAASEAKPPPAASEATAPSAWWRQARFGIFVHWGLYSILGRGEWAQWNEQIPVEEYARLAAQFHPQRFDADEWAATFKAAGAKYVVLTAKHHDGFALFDDPGNPFTSVSTAAHRDFVADYVRAMRRASLRVGLYYSVLDWRFPGYLAPGIYRASAEAMRAEYHRQVPELLSNYGPIDVLWFDGGENDWLSFGGDWQGPRWVRRPPGQQYAGPFRWEHRAMYQTIRRLQPDVMINNRADMPADFHSREGDRALGDFDATRPWELCTTIVDGPWGWAPDAPIKPLRQLVRLLVQVAGRDGNLLLRTYGGSIYGTRGGPFLPGAYGVSTHQGRRIFVHVLDRPAGALTLPPLSATIVGASLLGGGKVAWTQTRTAVELRWPDGHPDLIDTTVVLELDRNADTIPPIVTDGQTADAAKSGAE